MPDALVLTAAALAVLTALAAGVLALHLQRRLHRVQRHAHGLAQQVELLRQSISGLTAGAAGMDRRMHHIESREKVLAARQETFENQQADEQPYAHAIRLVRHGAGSRRLIDELGLSDGEAELIVRLHGQRASA